MIATTFPAPLYEKGMLFLFSNHHGILIYPSKSETPNSNPGALTTALLKNSLLLSGLFMT